MLPTRKMLFLGNVLLIAAIGCIELSSAGDSLFGVVGTGSLNPGLSNTECQKLEEAFRRFDSDGNGEISRSDMEGIGAKFADDEGFSEGDKDAAQKCFSDLFSFYVELAGATGDVLTKEMVDNCKNIHVSKDDRTECKNRIGAVGHSLVIPMKRVQEGYLNSEEFTRVFKSLHVSEPFLINVGFSTSDTNHDGKVSLKEFYDSATKFLCTDDFASALLR